MKPLRFPLRFILLTAMLCVSVVPIALFSYWTIQNALEKEFAAVHEKHLLLAHNTTAALDRYALDVKAVYDTSAQLAQNLHFHPEQISLMEQLNILAFAQYDSSGDLIERYYGQAVLVPPSLSEIEMIPAEIKPEIQFSKIFISENAPPTIYLTSVGPKSNIWIAAINPNYLYNIQKSISFGDKGHAAIVDQFGSVIAHPNPSWEQAGKNIAKISIIKQMMRGESGVAQFYSPAMNADMIAGFATVPTTGWGVMIPQPTSELESKLKDLKQVTHLIAALCFIIVALLSWWISGIVVKPVKRLIKMTKDLSHHQYPLPFKKDDSLTSIEIDTLVTSFNTMAEEVDRGQKELEKRVIERTEELHKAEKQARHLASHDLVTGLPNRIAIRADAQKRIHRNEPFTLLFIDLDGFKPINDQYGHQMGDRLLKAFGERLRSNLGENDNIARYGGDEFIVLLDTDNTESAKETAEQLLTYTRNPFAFGEYKVSIQASIGLAQSKPDTHDLDQIIHDADIAMYNAKKAGKNCIVCSSV
ncbi:diguanylate cyclase domain-containing protein [Neptuniibacter sp. QD48_11]|uniref:diguanylate cyclase domain-containing protein n=1 Tax=unclassified Neptuniibacter TaxID=2630693 RepID=UPI0039F4980F